MEIQFEEENRLRGMKHLGDIGKGNTFRMPKGMGSDGTVWMVTANNSKDPGRKQQIRTVSLRAGSIAYKNRTTVVVRVEGYFKVSDWGKG